MRKLTNSSIATALVLAISTAVPADIVPLPGLVRMVDVSDDGNVAVGNYVLATNSAFLWTRGGGVVQPPEFASDFIVTALSGDGSTVVGTRRLGPFQLDASRWTANEGMRSLGLPGGSYPNGSGAVGVNRDGSVITGYGHHGSTQLLTAYAYRWTPDGTDMLMSRQHPSANPDDGSPRGLVISADGNTIGVVEAVQDPNTGHSFRWTSDGGLESLGTPPGSTHTMIYDMSTDGDSMIIVGATSGTYRWTESSGYGSLIPIPWSGFEDASGDLSIIAGRVFNQSVIWTEALGLVPVAEYASMHGVDLTGWEHMTVQTISEDGMTFGGVGDYNGVGSGFVMQVPGPSAISLIALTILSMRRRRC